MRFATILMAFVAGCAAATFGRASDSNASGGGAEALNWGEEIAPCVGGEARVDLGFSPQFVEAMGGVGGAWRNIDSTISDNADGVSVLMGCPTDSYSLRVRWLAL